MMMDDAITGIYWFLCLWEYDFFTIL